MNSWKKYIALLLAMVMVCAMALTGCIGDIGLDIIDRCTVHQVSAFDMNHRSPFRILLDAVDAGTRETQVIRPKWRPRGKDPHSLVTSQTRRTHRQTLRMVILRELPDEPEIVEVIQSTNGLHPPVSRFKNNASRQFTDESTLPRNAKLRFHRRMKIGYRMYVHLLSVAKVRKNKRNAKFF